MTSSTAIPTGGSLIVGAGGIFVFDPEVTASTSVSALSAGNGIATQAENGSVTQLVAKDSSTVASESQSTALLDVSASTVSNTLQPTMAIATAGSAIGKGPDSQSSSVVATVAAGQPRSLSRVPSVAAHGLVKAHDVALASFVLNLPTAPAAWFWAGGNPNGYQQQARIHNPTVRTVDEVLARFGTRLEPYGPRNARHLQ